MLPWLRSRYPALAASYRADPRRLGLREWLRANAPAVLAEYDGRLRGRDGRTQAG